MSDYGMPSWDDGTEIAFEENVLDGSESRYLVRLYCDPGEDGTPEPEEIAAALVALPGVHHVRLERLHIAHDERTV